MKVTTLGVVLALKNIGSWLASYTVAGLKANPEQFIFSLLIFILITTPSDLLMLNHLSNKEKENATHTN